MRTSIVVSVALVIALVLWSKRFGSPAAPAVWHQGPRWARFLDLYDGWIGEMYAGCTRHRVGTSFGETQIFACGDRADPPVLFLHGAGSNSFIYGDWVLPRVAHSHYAIAVDFVCDVGLSAPRDGNVAKCPQTDKELAQWVAEVARGANLTRAASVVGYSYGAFVAMTAAAKEPRLVDKVVLIAPAAVLAPLQFGWMWRAMVYGLLWEGPWFFSYMSAKEGFIYERDMGSARHVEFSRAIHAVAATKLAVHPAVLSDDTLRAVAAEHDTLVVVGARETVTDPDAVAAVCMRLGLRVVTVPEAGHLMLIEKPARLIVEALVSSFLNDRA